MKRKLLPVRWKCCDFLIVFGLLFPFTAASYAGNGNTYKQKTIDLEVVELDLHQVLNKISRMADVRFFYDHSMLNVKRKLTLHLKDCPLEEAVKRVFTGQPVNCEYLHNRTIVVKPFPQSQQIAGRKITGVVIDSEEETPLPGASVVLAEQKSIGVVTDENGKFSFTVPDGVTAIVISFVGYQAETFRLGSKTKLTDLVIKLTSRSVEMEDVVVTGMAPRKVESFSGSYVSVKGDELKRLNPNNLLAALQLFDPSFRLVENNQQGSNPNALPEFRMRGDVQLGKASTPNLDILVGDYSTRPNTPLFILDGFEATLQRIVDLDPERVESITILKDAAATAIYGSKAANGVVVFETKKPVEGALRLSYSTNLGITVPDLTDYNLMDAAEKLQFEFDAGLFDVTKAEDMNYYNKYKEEVLRGVNTYWLSAPLRTPFLHRHTLSMQGGDKAFRYNLSLNYGSQPGVMKESERRNLGVGLSIQYRRKKWNISNDMRVNNTRGFNTSYGDFSEYTRLNPYYRMTDEQGKYIKTLDIKAVGAGMNKVNISNPLYNTQFPYKNESKNFNVTDNFSIECRILENLRVNAQASFTKGSARSEIFKSMNHTSFKDTELTARGSYNKNDASDFRWSANASVSYNLTIDKHLLSFMGRYHMDESTSDGIYLSAKGFPNDEMTDFLFAYEMDNRVSGAESTSRSLGVVGQVSYMYDMRYSADFSIRGDRASRFGSETKMAPFWSVGARWNVHREKWLKHTFISNLVVRGSFGLTGSQSYSAYQATEMYSFDDLLFPYKGSDVIGAQLKGFGNPNLGWSKTMNRSFALEVAFWKGRVRASVNYYNDLTKNLLLTYNIAPSTGFGTMVTNAGQVSNSGTDVHFSITPFRDYKREIYWSVSWNGSHNKNEIKKISNEIRKMNEQNMQSKGAPEPIYQEGRSTSMLYAVRSVGIDPGTGREVFLDKEGNKTYTWNASYKVPVGDSEPKLRGSLMTSFTWKSLSLSLACSYQWGAWRYNSTLVSKIENTTIGYNVDRRAAQDRWREVGDVTRYKAIKLTGQATESSTRFIQKFNEFKGSSLSVGYRLNSENFKFLRSCKVASISLNTAFNDIFRLSTVKQERGLSYPFARTFNLSISVLFN